MNFFGSVCLSSSYLDLEDLSQIALSVSTLSTGIYNVIVPDLSNVSSDVYNPISGLQTKLQETTFRELSNSIQLSDSINTTSGIIRKLEIVKITPDEYTERTAKYQLSNQIVLIQEDQLNAYDQRVVNVADPILETDAMTLKKFKSMLSTQIDSLGEDSTAAQIVEALKKIYTL